MLALRRAAADGAHLIRGLQHGDLGAVGAAAKVGAPRAGRRQLRRPPAGQPSLGCLPALEQRMLRGAERWGAAAAGGCAGAGAGRQRSWADAVLRHTEALHAYVYPEPHQSATRRGKVVNMRSATQHNY